LQHGKIGEIMKKIAHLNLAVLLGATISVPALAQSSVTLYGVLDTGVSYQSSQTTLGSTSGGRSNLKLASGVWYGSRFGFKGAEDLGGGLKAIFQLESGFNLDTGAAQFTNAAFSRQAWVGLSSPQYGTLTAGRQYTPYYTLISPYGPTIWLTAFTGAHPGDVDGMDTTYRANNSLVYISPKFYGLSFGGSYSLAGDPGSLIRGATWAGAVQYSAGPIGLAVGLTRLYNSTPGGGAYGADSTTTQGGETGVSAVTNGYQTAQAQQRFAVSGDYQFTHSFDVSFTYTNVQYIPGIGSNFRNTEIFNTGGLVLHWKASVAWDISGGYSYTRASKANGISDAAQYQQISLSQQYSLSKRTSLYVLEAYQRAHGNTLGTNGAGNIIRATATIGDGYQTAPSSSPSQAVAVVGIIHRF
jgi:predicted porin